jgi:hypothetical protein
LTVTALKIHHKTVYRYRIVGALLLGSLSGISIGSHVAARISDRFLLPVLASIIGADRPAAYHVVNEHRLHSANADCRIRRGIQLGIRGGTSLGEPDATHP